MNPARLLHQQLVLIVLVLTMLTLQSLNASSGTWLEYQRAAILHGEVWRLLSGHFIHINWSHLLLNLAGLALIWILGFSDLGMIRQLTAIFLCCLAISCAMLVFNPGLDWYRGFSGVLHGLFAIVAVRYLSDHRYFSLLLLVSLALKIVYEKTLGPMPWHQDPGNYLVVVNAHLYGSITGLLVAALFYWHPADRQEDEITGS